MGNDPFLALVAKDNKVETLKEAVKAQEKIETEEWFEEEESNDDEEEEEDEEDEDDKDMDLFYFTAVLDARLCVEVF